MFRRLIFYIVCLVFVFVGVFQVYQRYETTKLHTANITTIKYDLSSAIDISTLNQQIQKLQDGEFIYALFYETNDINSQYMFNVTLDSILTQHNLQQIDQLYLVNITDLSQEAKNNLNSRYGFSSAPALAKLHYASGTVQVDSAIQEDATTLLTQEIVEKWFIENGLLTEIQPTN